MTIAQQADLALAKTVSNATPNVGDTIAYIVTLSNSGPDSATNVQVTDPLPAGFSFVSAMPGQGTYNPSTGLWSVGTVHLVVPETLVILAQVVDPGSETNTATIIHSDQFDPNLANSTASVTVTPQQANLAIVKSVNDTTPQVGDTIVYTVTLANFGPDAATHVQVTDPLPAGESFVSAMPSQGTYDPSTGLWSVGTVHLDFPETLVILARVDIAGLQSNTATITHTDQFDPSPANNAMSVVVFATPAIPPTAIIPPPSSVLVPLRLPRTADGVRPDLQLGPRPGPCSGRSKLHPCSDRFEGPYRAENPYRFSGLRSAHADGHARSCRSRLSPRPHKLIVNGEAPSGLASPSGTLLDGQGNGKPGSDYVKTFGPSILAGPYPGFSASAFLKFPHPKPVVAHPTTKKPITVRHSPPKPVVAHPTTKKPITVRHSPTSSEQGKRSASKTAKSPHNRLNAKAVDAALATMTSPHSSKNLHREVARR